MEVLVVVVLKHTMVLGLRPVDLELRGRDMLVAAVLRHSVVLVVVVLVRSVVARRPTTEQMGA
jgi:hypothetical protein